MPKNPYNNLLFNHIDEFEIFLIYRILILSYLTLLQEGTTAELMALGSNHNRPCSVPVNKRKIKQLGYVASPGTHVLWQAMNMLLRDSAEYLNESKVGCMMDLRPISEINEEYISPRVINTHYRLDVLPQEFRRSRTVLGTCHMV